MKTLFASAAVLLLATQTVCAQSYRGTIPAGSYGPYSRPGLSPYLNLIRGGDPAANYYLGVIPERDRRASEVQQGALLLDLEQRSGLPSAARDPLSDPVLPGTGHPTYFQNYSGYYNFTPGRPISTAPQGGGQRRGR